MYCPIRQKYKTSDRFGNLMELYEKNYMQLRLLIPGLKHGPLSPGLSEVQGCLPVHLNVTEQSRYTSTLHLTYRFAEGSNNRDQLEPDFSIRVYHDARTAEVVSGLLHGQQHVQRTTRNLQNSWRLNRFLYKWLSYLLRRGHRFEVSQEGTSWRESGDSNSTTVVGLGD